MPSETTISQLQDAVRQSYHRLKSYRQNRAMMVREFVGEYYNSLADRFGEKPLNLIYTTIRSIVPSLVMRNPKFTVGLNQDAPNPALHTRAAEIQRDLNSIAEQIYLRNTLRAGIVDAFFGFGIFKTALKRSNRFITVDDTRIDTGQAYVGRVDLDDLVFDPCSIEYLFTDASFLGNRVRVSRQTLLDLDDVNTGIVERLPNVLESGSTKDRPISELSELTKFGGEYAAVKDLVDVIELWVPEHETMVLLPDPFQLEVNEPIREVDYHGPEEGPFEFLSFSQPVPNNPFPIAPISVWIDLYNVTNDIFRKGAEQALSQKDVGVYDPANAEMAERMVEARNGDMIAGDPNSINIKSIGGINPDNSGYMNVAQSWFNYMAGNPDMLAGLQSDTETATQAQILQGNANIVIADARDIIEDMTGEIGKRLAWYIVDEPLDTRFEKEDWLEFSYRVVPKSMIRLDPNIRVRRTQELFINIIPALAQTTMTCSQLGVPFNFTEAVRSAASGLDIEDQLIKVFEDPMVVSKMAALSMSGPASPGRTRGGVAQSSMAGVQQQGGYAGQQQIEGTGTIQRQQQQATAAEAQSMNQGAY